MKDMAKKIAKATAGAVVNYPSLSRGVTGLSAASKAIKSGKGKAADVLAKVMSRRKSS